MLGLKTIRDQKVKSRLHNQLCDLEKNTDIRERKQLCIASSQKENENLKTTREKRNCEKSEFGRISYCVCQNAFVSK